MDEKTEGKYIEPKIDSDQNQCHSEQAGQAEFGNRRGTNAGGERFWVRPRKTLYSDRKTSASQQDNADLSLRSYLQLSLRMHQAVSPTLIYCCLDCNVPSTFRCTSRENTMLTNYCSASYVPRKQAAVP